MNSSCFFGSAFGNLYLGRWSEKPNSWRRYWHWRTFKTTPNLFLTCSDTLFPSQLLNSYPNLRGCVRMSFLSSSFWSLLKRQGLPGGVLGTMASNPPLLNAFTQDCIVTLDFFTMLATFVQLPSSCIKNKA